MTNWANHINTDQIKEARRSMIDFKIISMVSKGLT